MSNSLKRARLNRDDDLKNDSAANPVALANCFERLNPRELESTIGRILETGNVTRDSRVSPREVAYAASFAKNGPDILLALARVHPGDSVAGFVQALHSPFFEDGDDPKSSSGAQFMAGARALAELQADSLLAALAKHRVLPWACLRLLFCLGRDGMVCSWLAAHQHSNETSWLWRRTLEDSCAYRSELHRLLQVATSTAVYTSFQCAAATRENVWSADAGFTPLTAYLRLFCSVAVAAAQTKLPQTNDDDGAFCSAAKTLLEALAELASSISSLTVPWPNSSSLLALSEAAVWVTILSQKWTHSDNGLAMLSMWHHVCPVPALHAAALLIDLAVSPYEDSSVDATQLARSAVARSLNCTLDQCEGSLLFLPSTHDGIMSLASALRAFSVENSDCWYSPLRLSTALLEVSVACPTSDPGSIGGLAIDAVAACLGEGGVLESSKSDVHDWIFDLLMRGSSGRHTSNNSHPSLLKLLDRYARACFPRKSCQFLMRPLLPSEISILPVGVSAEVAAFTHRYLSCYNDLGLPAPLDYGGFFAQLPDISINPDNFRSTKDEAQWTTRAVVGGSFVTSHRLRLLATSDSTEGHHLLRDLVHRLARDPMGVNENAHTLALAWRTAHDQTRCAQSFLLTTTNALLATIEVPEVRWIDLVREPLVLLSLGDKLLHPPLLSIVLTVFSAVSASSDKNLTLKEGAKEVCFYHRHYSECAEVDVPSENAFGLLTDVVLVRSLLSLCAVEPPSNSNCELTAALLVTQWLDKRLSRQPRLLQAMVHEGLSFSELMVVTSTMHVAPCSYLGKALPLLMINMLRTGSTLDMQLNAVTLAAALAQNGLIANGSPSVLEHCLSCAASVASLASFFSQSTLPQPSLRALMLSSIHDLSVLIANQPTSFQRTQGLAASLRPLHMFFKDELNEPSSLIRAIALNEAGR
jgi:hypothetical protein